MKRNFCFQKFTARKLEKNTLIQQINVCGFEWQEVNFSLNKIFWSSSFCIKKRAIIIFFLKKIFILIKGLGENYIRITSGGINSCP